MEVSGQKDAQSIGADKHVTASDRSQERPNIIEAGNCAKVITDLKDQVENDPYGSFYEVIEARDAISKLKEQQEVVDLMKEMLKSPRITRPIQYPYLVKEMDSLYSQSVKESKLGLRLAQAGSILAGAAIIIAGLPGLTLGNLTLSVMATTVLPFLLVPWVNREYIIPRKKEKFMEAKTRKADERIKQDLAVAEKHLEETMVKAQAALAEGKEGKKKDASPAASKIKEESGFIVVAGIKLKKHELEKMKEKDS
jgi:hypothetical protein